jgi:hypothetical protein
MIPKAGKWFMDHGIMDQIAVKQILQFQEHGDGRKFGEIALAREMINGKDLRHYLEDAGLPLH